MHANIVDALLTRFETAFRDGRMIAACRIFAFPVEVVTPDVRATFPTEFEIAAVLHDLRSDLLMRGWSRSRTRTLDVAVTDQGLRVDVLQERWRGLHELLSRQTIRLDLVQTARPGGGYRARRVSVLQTQTNPADSAAACTDHTS